MVRNLLLFPLAILTVFMIGCGGGSNDNPPNTLARLEVQFTGDGVSQTFVQVEMVKNLITNVGRASVSASLVFPNNTPVNDTVRTINLSDYSVSYRRLDGGTTTPATFNGTISGIIRTGNQPSNFDIVIFPVSEKLTSPFAQEFLGLVNSGQANPVDMEVTLTVRGRVETGDAIQASDTIRIQAAVFQPVDELLPTIGSFNQTTNVTIGQDYQASWFVNVGRFPVTGQFITPWGDSLALGTQNFPSGILSFPTDNFVPGRTSTPREPQLEPGQSIDYAAGGQLIVSNVFGSNRTTENENVRFTNPPLPDPDPEPEPDPVTIDQFFPIPSQVTQGEDVTISVLTSGNVTRAELIPSVYDGVTVTLPDKPEDLESFSFTIRPDFSVRPLLVIYDDVNNLRSSAFLSTQITVVPAQQTAPQILFYRASNTTVPVGGRVALFWRTTGEVERIELLPINNSIIDVTGRTSFVTPPFNAEGVQTINLIVTPPNGGTPLFQTLTVNVTNNANQPVVIRDINQQPSAVIGNNDQGAFSFTIDDPERQDSSWRVTKVAGDNASYLPISGKIPGGLGDDVVTFRDRGDNGNGFLTFEISAWDDSNFGFSVGSNRTVELVTFTTSDSLADNAPVITNENFTAATDDNSEGTISFDYSDPDTLSLEWTVRIAAGDFGGTIERGRGTTNNGAGTEAVRYVDDPDTPDADVVFLIQVKELIAINPQSDVALIQLNKGTGDVTTNNPDPTQNPITFEFFGLFDNNNGRVDAFDEIANFTLFFNGDLAGSPQFFKNSDLSDPVNAASFVVDIKHSTNDPQSTTDVKYTRDFITPNTVTNLGDFSFVNYFPNGGSSVGGSNMPIDAGVARWNMLFSIESFRNANTNMLNLPSASGTRTYSVLVEATDNQGEKNTATQVIRVAVP